MKFLFFLLILIAGGRLTAQEKRIAALLNGELQKPGTYQPVNRLTEQHFEITCNFGKDLLTFPASAQDEKQIQIVAVDLVFTDFPSDNDLKKLNAARLQHLFSKYPSLINDSAVEWKIIRQMDGAERERGMQLFHGFVVYYRPLQSKATAASDIMKLKEMLSPKEGSPKKRRNGFLIKDTMRLRAMYEIEEYVFVGKLPVREAEKYLDVERDIRSDNSDSVFVYEKPGDSPATDKTEMRPPPDSTVLKVLDRNAWKNMLVVTDVTASMYPYIGQLLIWLRLHEDERRINHFIFFNDGDNMDDDKKIAGKTGGIYHTASSVYEVVEQMVYRAMANGCGGNIPENNMEALLKGIALCPDCSEVVMIADNNSGVSDMSLLAQINKPVHIILCGVHEKINPDYIAIAKQTGGSIHLMEEDIAENK